MQFISKGIHDILAEPGFNWWMIAVGVIMYGAWTTAYVCIITSCFRQKSYGVPFVCLCFNVILEFSFSTMILYQGLFWFFKWGNLLWFVFDVIIAYQFFRYGREQQVIPFIKEHFYSIAIVTL